jgi:hypothetical protein
VLAVALCGAVLISDGSASSSACGAAQESSDCVLGTSG